MFHPLPLFIGFRYVRARTHRFFVSFITWAALVGVGVGMAALIVILSVMNGFEDELRDRLVSLSAHARVVMHEGATSPAGPEGNTAAGGPLTADKPNAALGPTEAQWASAENVVRSVKGVVGVAPYVELQGLAVRTPEMQPVVLRGVDPKAEMTVSDLAHSLIRGRFSDLVPGTDRVIVGSVVAERLGVGVGDTLNVLIPTVSEGAAPSSKLREFTVAGVFEVGQVEADSSLVYASLQDVGSINPGSVNGRGLRVRFDDPLHAPQISPQLRRLLPKTFDVFDWTQDNASYFRAISIEKTMMALILLLIVAVAAFNIVAMLVMVVTDKRTDIAILRTLGASPRRVMGVFITQGLVIGWAGVALGLMLGLALAYNVDTIVPFLERTLRFQIMDSDVFYDSSIPSHVRWENVVTIAVASLALTGLATIYPAIRAARTAPAEALRYE